MSASADDASQSGFAYRFGWGLDGLAALAPHCDVIVVVDVLRFTSATSAAIEAGATVFPSRWQDDRAAAYAAAHDAVLAGDREFGAPSLSPTDLLATRPRDEDRAAVTQRVDDLARSGRAWRPIRAGRIAPQRLERTARRARALAHDGASG